MADTSIQWTDKTWSVAERFWARQSPAGPDEGYGIPGAVNQTRPRQFTDVQTHEDRLLEPLKWRKPARVFVNSMSDLFHEDVPDAFIDKVFAVMALSHRHTFQVLTKRPERMRDYLVEIYSPRGAERRLLAAEAIYGDAIQRGRRLRVSEVGGAGDRLGGSSLAGEAAAGVRSDQPVRTDEGRGVERPVSAGQGDHERRSEVCGSASAGVAPLQRCDSAREDRQPQRRRDGEQPTVESRTGNVEGADGARLHDLEAPESRSSRGVEHAHGPNGSGRDDHSVPGPGRQGIADNDRRGLPPVAGRGLPDRVAALLETHPLANTWLVGAVLPNVWAGVSCENQHFADERIPLLLQTPAAVRFISAEPLLGPVDLKNIASARDEMMLALAGLTWGLDGRLRGEHAKLDWVIVGESGPKSRPFDLTWARSIVQQCQAAGVPVFVKQLGAVPFSKHGSTDLPQRESVSRIDRQRIGFRDRTGGDMAEWPDDLRVREVPTRHTVAGVVAATGREIREGR